MKALTIAAGTALAMTGPLSPLAAQPYPSKPVRIVVGFPPAGPTDYTARLIAEKMPALLGVNAIVDNRPGANATIGADTVAKSLPDTMR